MARSIENLLRLSIVRRKARLHTTMVVLVRHVGLVLCGNVVVLCAMYICCAVRLSVSEAIVKQLACCVCVALVGLACVVEQACILLFDGGREAGSAWVSWSRRIWNVEDFGDGYRICI